MVQQVAEKVTETLKECSTIAKKVKRGFLTRAGTTVGESSESAE